VISPGSLCRPLNARLLELSPVKGRVVVDISHCRFEPILLKGVQVLEGHALNMRIPVTGHLMINLRQMNTRVNKKQSIRALIFLRKDLYA